MVMLTRNGSQRLVMASSGQYWLVVASNWEWGMDSSVDHDW